MPGIFISYRREDCPGHAGRIFDRLRSRFGSDVVFMDVTAIEAGVDFVDVLHKAVGSCDALLAVIGPQWLSATHDGKRRLDDPHDFVRIEIAGALQRNVRVLPVLVEGASVPPTEGLPDDLQALTRRQAVELRDARWDDDIERLVEGLAKFLTPTAPAHVADTERPAVKSSIGRGLAIGAVAALILVAGAALAWRGGLLSGGRAGNVTDPPRPTPIPGQTLDKPAGPVAVNAAANPGEGSVAPPPESASATTPVRPPVTAKPVETAPAPPPSNTPTPAPAPSNAAAMPNVVGRTIPEAREMLRRAGFRFLIRIHEDKANTPGIVETQQLDESTGANQVRRVVLTAVAISTVLVHVAKGDERKADDLAAYLKDQPSAIGTLVRGASVVPRAELVGMVAYSEDRLAGQAESIAKDATEYLMRAGTKRSLQAVLRPRVARGTIIVGLYERAP